MLPGPRRRSHLRTPAATGTHLRRLAIRARGRGSDAFALRSRAGRVGRGEHLLAAFRASLRQIARHPPRPMNPTSGLLDATSASDGDHAVAFRSCIDFRFAQRPSLDQGHPRSAETARASASLAAGRCVARTPPNPSPFRPSLRPTASLTGAMRHVVAVDLGHTPPAPHTTAQQRVSRYRRAPRRPRLHFLHEHRSCLGHELFHKLW